MIHGADLQPNCRLMNHVLLWLSYKLFLTCRGTYYVVTLKNTSTVDSLTAQSLRRLAWHKKIRQYKSQETNGCTQVMISHLQRDLCNQVANDIFYPSSKVTVIVSTQLLCTYFHILLSKGLVTLLEPGSGHMTHRSPVFFLSLIHPLCWRKPRNAFL